MKFYVNTITGEETDRWSDAQVWHRCGIPVQVWRNGRNVLTINM